MKINILAGTRFYSLKIAEALLEAGQDVAIYTSSPKSRLISQAERQPSVHFIPLLATLAQYFLRTNTRFFEEPEMLLFDQIAAKVMRPHDVLHGFASYSLYSAIKTKRRGGKFFLERACPHVLFQEKLLREEADQLQIPHRSRSQNWIDRSIAEYDLADAIIVPSTYTYNTFIEQGYPPEKLSLIRLDKNTSKTPPYRPYQHRDEFVVGVVGGNIVRKGYYYLLKAWTSLKLPKARLLLKTSEKEISRSPLLTKLISAMSNVTVVGYVDDINDFYQQCDIFCLPSIDDGFGMVVIEAMVNSLPVIVTSNVGASDLLEDYSVGFLIPPRSSAEVAEKLLFFYENRWAIDEMGRNAYNLALEIDKQRRYSSDIISLYANHGI